MLEHALQFFLRPADNSAAGLAGAGSHAEGLALTQRGQLICMQQFWWHARQASAYICFHLVEGIASKFDMPLQDFEFSNQDGKALRDLAANQPPLPGICPDYAAPIVWLEDGQRIMANARRGLLGPPFAVRSRNWQTAKSRCPG